VDAEPPNLSVAGAEGDPSGAGPPRRRRGSQYLPVVLGVAAGAAAIAVAIVLLRGNGEAAPPVAPAPPPAAESEPQEILRIVFPEGFTRTEMAERITEVNEIARANRGISPTLSADDYLAATKRSAVEDARARLPAEFAGDPKVKTLEGFLFPATYEFTQATVSPELVDFQLEAFAREWAKIDLSYAKKRKLTAYDVLIIASMIEGEVQVPKERALVAAVIYNRLKKRMPLGIDATIRYGLNIPPTRPIRQSELDDPNPYNTRIHRGLPPTPIGNPGLASIQAAAHPADVDYLYFVRKKDCKSHFFTASEAEFLERLEKPRC
jgi:UPF0755 protein